MLCFSFWDLTCYLLKIHVIKKIISHFENNNASVLNFNWIKLSWRLLVYHWLWRSQTVWGKYHLIAIHLYTDIKLNHSCSLCILLSLTATVVYLWAYTIIAYFDEDKFTQILRSLIVFEFNTVGFQKPEPRLFLLLITQCFEVFLESLQKINTEMASISQI